LDSGILICADREESGDGTKRAVDKLVEFNFRNSTFVFGASGVTAIIANLYTRLYEGLSANEDDLLRSHTSIISDALRSVRNDFPEFDDWVELVVSASFYRDVSTPVASFLYGTVGSVLQPEAEYCCKGPGKDLARYFCHRLFSPWPDRRHAMIIAAFIFREVENHVEGVGFGTDMKYVATQHRKIQTIPSGDVAKLEEKIPILRETLIEYWRQKIKAVPQWLIADIYESEAKQLYE